MADVLPLPESICLSKLGNDASWEEIGPMICRAIDSLAAYVQDHAQHMRKCHQSMEGDVEGVVKSVRALEKDAMKADAPDWADVDKVVMAVGRNQRELQKAVKSFEEERDDLRRNLRADLEEHLSSISQIQLVQEAAQPKTQQMARLHTGPPPDSLERRLEALESQLCVRCDRRIDELEVRLCTNTERRLEILEGAIYDNVQLLEDKLQAGALDHAANIQKALKGKLDASRGQSLERKVARTEEHASTAGERVTLMEEKVAEIDQGLERTRSAILEDAQKLQQGLRTMQVELGSLRRSIFGDRPAEPGTPALPWGRTDHPQATTTGKDLNQGAGPHRGHLSGIGHGLSTRNLKGPEREVEDSLSMIPLSGRMDQFTEGLELMQEALHILDSHKVDEDAVVQLKGQITELENVQQELKQKQDDLLQSTYQRVDVHAGAISKLSSAIAANMKDRPTSAAVKGMLATPLLDVEKRIKDIEVALFSSPGKTAHAHMYRSPIRSNVVRRLDNPGSCPGEFGSADRRTLNSPGSHPGSLGSARNWDSFRSHPEDDRNAGASQSRTPGSSSEDSDSVHNGMGKRVDSPAGQPCSPAGSDRDSQLESSSHNPGDLSADDRDCITPRAPVQAVSTENVPGI
ncbi:hypothetical protein CYMTET_43219 [Cymbomonas tetramitiformis]|uniref:Uncharacterized protein n=1 Tax=Cymbomonas tetramitiformis TaxID=36881 RepID=A0AAE0C2H7_9CHLO|nr:hypothetical protein CYMTET_43219 [Cymbomonas tetramitiformis]